MKSIDQLTFDADRRKDGKWVGRCKEWPEVKGPVRSDKLSALDAVIAVVADKIRDAHFGCQR